MKAKKFISLILCAVFAGGIFAACKVPPREVIVNEDPIIEGVVTDRDSIDYSFNKMYAGRELIDEASGFGSSDYIEGARYIINNVPQEKYTTEEYNGRHDIKFEFYNGEFCRIVDVSGGMAFTVPAENVLDIDYSISAYRTQVVLGDSILTYSADGATTYSSQGTEKAWTTYRDEWLLRWLRETSYYAKNDLELIKEVFNDTTSKPGFDMYMYSVRINDASEKIERPYYNIGVVRPESDAYNFGFFVMKSKEDRTDDMESILLSYNKISSKGVRRNYYSAGAPTENPKWNAETKAYYQKMLTQQTVDWGAFNYSMPGNEYNVTPNYTGTIPTNALTYERALGVSKDMQKAVEDIWEHDFDIYPTYTHIGWTKDLAHFPLAMANELAGGNGFNGKPVLQFTYQYTVDNNNVASNSTPLFDIMRGVYDSHFEKLADDIKAYGKPVLFRLNNEMNSDWTSYCGMLTLNDPDIFIMTWRYLYDIFERKGVDNCMWIWNPNGKAIPHSKWGEDLCYNPGEDYVQFLGLTEYEMGNGETLKSYETYYSELYGKNTGGAQFEYKLAYGEYKAIISEFGCGSGGAVTRVENKFVPTVLGRNREAQAKWITDMFTLMNKPVSSRPQFAKQIVGAVWFNCNDYNDANEITNRLRFVTSVNHTSPIQASENFTDLVSTYAAFKKGFSDMFPA